MVGVREVMRSCLSPFLPFALSFRPHLSRTEKASVGIHPEGAAGSQGWGWDKRLLSSKLGTRVRTVWAQEGAGRGRKNRNWVMPACP